MGSGFSIGVSVVIGGAFFYFFPFLVEENLAQQIGGFIGASFVGMVSNKFASPIYVMLAGLIFSIIYLNKAQF